VFEDALFAGLPPAARTRHHKRRRRCYRDFLRELTCEVRRNRRHISLAMSSANRWDAREYVSAFFRSELALLTLRWVYWTSRLGIRIDPNYVSERLNGVASFQKFREAAV
jgi:hypothetical protein